MRRVTITGGGGYVGSMLVPHLLSLGHEVTVLDKFWFGEGVLKPQRGLRIIKGDIRDESDLVTAFQYQDAVIHLACISNDPSFEMNPHLGKSINYDAFSGILKTMKWCGVKRFIYASSSSVYGASELEKVTEDAPCNPLTDYSKFKLLCEEDLKAFESSMSWVIVRPATVCGWAPRLRLDLIVNALAIKGLVEKKIEVHGGDQFRPNVNIRDICLTYSELLRAPTIKIDRKTFNVGYQNHKVIDLANMVREALEDKNIEIEVQPIKDHRSYRVTSEKIRQELGIHCQHSIKDAVQSLGFAYQTAKIRNPLKNPIYYNIAQMKKLGEMNGNPV